MHELPVEKAPPGAELIFFTLLHEYYVCVCVCVCVRARFIAGLEKSIIDSGSKLYTQQKLDMFSISLGSTIGILIMMNILKK